MPRSLVSRSLEPLVGVLWGVFLVWTAWLAVVWIVPVGVNALGLTEIEPLPPNTDLRRAVLMLAENAELVWLTLAVMNLHLVLTHTNGLRTARVWLALSAGGAVVLAVLNVKSGMIFGRFHFGDGLGAKFLGVAIGWALLWAVLVIASREAVLWMRPRASHHLGSILTAFVVVVTVLNLEWPARFVRVWWVWQPGYAGVVPWRFWIAWFACSGLMAFAMREKDVSSGVVARSGKPAIILAALNAIALAARLRLG